MPSNNKRSYILTYILTATSSSRFKYVSPFVTTKQYKVEGTFMQIKKQKINAHFNKIKSLTKLTSVYKFSSLLDLWTWSECWNETTKVLLNGMKALNKLKALNYKNGNKLVHYLMIINLGFYKCMTVFLRQKEFKFLQYSNN